MFLIVSAMLCALTTEGAMKDGIQTLPGEMPQVAKKNPSINYATDLAKEKFDVFVPSGHSETRPFGLLVFISPSEECVVPAEWKSILKTRKLVWVAPQKVGNKQDTARRAGLAVTAALKMADELKLDRQRLYISGFSGGARVACMTAFRHPEIFSGCISICGAEFYAGVPKKDATKDDDYGSFVLPGEFPEADKHNLYFALITGKTDFRRGNILDLYNGGFKKHAIKSTLIDVNGMGHQLCSARTFDDAIKFVDQQRPPKPLPAELQVQRTWTDAKGNTLVASLTQVAGGMAHFKLENGRTLKVPISDLSAEDQDFMKSTK